MRPQNKSKIKVINVIAHLENRLSTHYNYAIIKTQIANLGKLTALSEEAVSLISSNYSPYSKVLAWLVTSIEKQWSKLLDTNSQLKLRTTIPELLATEELEPNSRNLRQKV